MKNINEIKVPWNASWTGEESFEVRPCKYAKGAMSLWQKTAPGVGQPLFAKPHMIRQRKSIAEMRCTVCGEKTEKFKRFYFREMGHEITMQGKKYWATTEAPLHENCIEHAIKLCPQLKKNGFEPLPFPEDYYVLSALAGQSLNDQYNVKINVQVVGHMKLAWQILDKVVNFNTGKVEDAKA